MVDDRPAYSVSSLAERWSCSTGLVRKLIHGGQLAAARYGNLLRIKAAEVDRYEGARPQYSPTAKEAQVDDALQHPLAAGRSAREARTKQPAEDQSFLFRIIRCQPNYGMMLNPMRKGHVAEYFHPRFVCECLWPRKYSGHEYTLVILGDRDFQPKEIRGAQSIGTLILRGKTCSYIGSLELQMLARVVSDVPTGLYRYISMSGSALVRGQSDIRSLFFDYDYEAADFPNLPPPPLR